MLELNFIHNLHNLSLIILGEIQYKEDEYLKWTESKGNENSIS